MAAPSWNHADADPTFLRRAVSQIEAHADSRRPFFLYLAASAPHEPCLEATVPEFARGQSGAGSLGDLVWLFDWMVGEVVAALERTSQAEDTLVIVTSDNGALPGDRVRPSPGMDGYELFDHRSCGDWRGYKAHIWEGGHRVPFVVGPAATRAADVTASGRVDATPACLTDLFRTLSRIAGAEGGAPDLETAEDSVDLSSRQSFARWLASSEAGRPSSTEIGDGDGGGGRSAEERGVGGVAPRGARLSAQEAAGTPMAAPLSRVAMVHHSGAGVFAARMANWKLVFESIGSGGWPPPKGGPPFPGSRGQLYDLASDPTESRNLYDEKPKTVAELAELLEGFRAGEATIGPA